MVRETLMMLHGTAGLWMLWGASADSEVSLDGMFAHGYSRFQSTRCARS